MPFVKSTMRLVSIAFACVMAFAQPRARESSVHQYRGPSDADLVTRVFYPTHLNAPQDLQELVNLVRVITDTQRMFPDSTRESIVMRGTAAQADVAEWLFRELDKPAEGHDSGKHEYRAPGDNDLVTRIFYPAHIKTTQSLQELVNTIRTIADAQRLFPHSGQQAIALRGTAGQVAMVEWLVNALDIPEDAGAGRRPSATYPYPEPAKLLPSGAKNPAWAPGDTVVRVYYLAHTGTPQGVQEAVNTIRTVAEIPRVFPLSALKAVVTRGTASQDALAEWLLNELDAPAGATAP